jgi:predicted amidophosphoribosyltransferase
MNFLLKLLDVLLPMRATRVLSTDASIESLGAYVAPTTHTLAAGRVTALLPYRTPQVRSIIHEAKYYDDVQATMLLGRILADYLISMHEDSPFDSASYLLVPVPLSTARYRERGFNQVERIVRAALKNLPQTFALETGLVARVRDTRPQARLSRGERLTNMKDAFVLRKAIPPNVTIVLIDDVATTGATLDAMRAAFSSQEFGNIHAIAIAH